MKSSRPDHLLKKGITARLPVVPLLIWAVVCWAAANTSLNKDYKAGAIEADAKGYYAYLPAVFIYHDLNFGFYDTIERGTYYNPNLYYDYRRDTATRTIDKYYAGTALCLAPFFLAGHVVTLAKGLPADGYSYYYTLFAHLGALFYLLLAMFGLQRLLRMFGMQQSVINWVLVAMVLGTNLFYYTVTEFGMSHVYSFTAVTWFCITASRYFTTHQSKYLVYSALLLGTITLLRPVNLLLVLALPFLAGSRKQLLAALKNMMLHKTALAWVIVCFLVPVGIQLILYKIATGHFLVYSYKQEGFHFLNPQLFNFLFSYRKGMFVYTPMLLLSLAGLVILYRSHLFRFYSLIVFLFVLVYVFSSWHMWFYGGSFSQRVMIEFYPFFAILLATFIGSIRKPNAKRLFLSLVVLLVLFCQVQTYQYRHMQIHWSDMNKEKYWDVFMRIDKL